MSLSLSEEEREQLVRIDAGRRVDNLDFSQQPLDLRAA
jgi:hypothetical protein